MPLVNERNLSVIANAKFLGSDISPSTPDSWVTITIIPVDAGKLTVVHDNGTNEDDGILNDDTELKAGAEYSFSVPVPTNPTTNVKESVNFKFSATTTLTKLIIAEGA